MIVPLNVVLRVVIHIFSRVTRHRRRIQEPEILATGASDEEQDEEIKDEEDRRKEQEMEESSEEEDLDDEVS